MPASLEKTVVAIADFAGERVEDEEHDAVHERIEQADGGGVGELRGAVAHARFVYVG